MKDVDAIVLPVFVDREKGLLVHKCECGRIHKDFLGTLQKQREMHERDRLIYADPNVAPLPIHLESVKFNWRCDCGRNEISHNVSVQISDDEKEKWKAYCDANGLPIPD